MGLSMSMAWRETKKRGGEEISSKDEEGQRTNKKFKQDDDVAAQKQKQKIPVLSQVLMEEIFLRLPPPSVARFKSVSSDWLRQLSDPSFAEKHQSRNRPLLGFYYNSSYVRVRLASINPFLSPHHSTGMLQPNQSYRAKREFGDSVLTALNSSNGLLLMYFSTFVGVNKRFLVHGFAFELYSINPSFTVVELTDTALNGGLRVNKYSSTARRWNSQVLYDVAPVLGDNNYVLSGPSTFHNGALHWLLEPSGVIAYDIHSDSLSFSLVKNIPGDMGYVDENGSCSCTTRKVNIQNSRVCTCRYLGESKGRLVYVRVIGDSEFSVWTLEDYYRGVWSPGHLIAVDDLPVSLYGGRVLAFDTTDACVVFLKVKMTIFSCNCISRELKKVCKIEKLYGGEDKYCLGFIFPYELPSNSPSIPASFWLGSHSSSGVAPMNNLTTTDPNHVRLYHHYGVTELAAKFLPDLQNANGLPFKSPIDLYAPASKAGLFDATLLYSDLVRAESIMYGGLGGRLQQNI